MADPTGGLSTAFSSISTAFKLIEFCYQLADVSSENRVFILLIVRVRRDLHEALRLLHNSPSVAAYLQETSSSKIDAIYGLGIGSGNSTRDWIEGTIEDCHRALADIGQFVEDVRVDEEGRGGKVALTHRFEWVLNNHAKLVTRERRLEACHRSLIAALQMIQSIEVGARIAGLAVGGGLTGKISGSQTTLTPPPTYEQTLGRAYREEGEKGLKAPNSRRPRSRTNLTQEASDKQALQDPAGAERQESEASRVARTTSEDIPPLVTSAFSSTATLVSPITPATRSMSDPFPSTVEETEFFDPLVYETRLGDRMDPYDIPNQPMYIPPHQTRPKPKEVPQSPKAGAWLSDLARHPSKADRDEAIGGLHRSNTLAKLISETFAPLNLTLSPELDSNSFSLSPPGESTSSVLEEHKQELPAREDLKPPSPMRSPTPPIPTPVQTNEAPESKPTIQHVQPMPSSPPCSPPKSAKAKSLPWSAHHIKRPSFIIPPVPPPAARPPSPVPSLAISGALNPPPPEETDPAPMRPYRPSISHAASAPVLPVIAAPSTTSLAGELLIADMPSNQSTAIGQTPAPTEEPLAGRPVTALCRAVAVDDSVSAKAPDHIPVEPKSLSYDIQKISPRPEPVDLPPPPPIPQLQLHDRSISMDEKEVVIGAERESIESENVNSTVHPLQRKATAERRRKLRARFGGSRREGQVYRMSDDLPVYLAQ